MSKQKKFILQESEIPTQWYNIQAATYPPSNQATIGCRRFGTHLPSRVLCTGA